MKHAERVEKNNVKTQIHIVQNIQNDMVVSEVLSEHEILSVQDALLTNGIHHIHVANVESGRLLLQLFLSSIARYHNIACFTQQARALPAYVTDLYQMFLKNSYPLITDATIENFLVEHFYFDFLWIELSTSLQQEYWFSRFYEALSRLGIELRIPIVVVHYCDKNKH